MANLDTPAKRYAGITAGVLPFLHLPPRPSGNNADTAAERAQLAGIYGGDLAFTGPVEPPEPPEPAELAGGPDWNGVWKRVHRPLVGALAVTDTTGTTYDPSRYQNGIAKFSFIDDDDTIRVVFV